jgi:hypothetical protein
VIGRRKQGGRTSWRFNLKEEEKEKIGRRWRGEWRGAEGQPLTASDAASAGNGNGNGNA